MKFSLLIILFCLALHSGYGKTGNGFPQGYFTNPLDTELILKGSFGEIRTDHFHSGIDISTGEKEGQPVFAVADGYISRIKISSTGFGKALYVTHPNGIVSVYAHLKFFEPDIEKYVRTAQFVKESFEIELIPKPRLLKVRKGNPIAWSGNTGSSEGPHLHFELRDEKSEEPVNPLLFGLTVNDTLAPVITSLRVYPQAFNGVVEMSDVPFSYPVVFKDGRYTVNVPDYVKVFGTIAFGIEAVDYANNSTSALGIYSISLRTDSQTVYDIKMDRFSFSDTRYANACIDYSWRYAESKTVYRCFKLPGVPELMPIKAVGENNGFLQFNDEQAHPLLFRVSDFAGNTAELAVDILAMQPSGEIKYQYPPVSNIRLSPSQGAAIHKSHVEVVIPKNTVYNNYALVLEEETVPGANYFSKIISVGNPFEPLHASITVGLLPLRMPDSLKEKAVIVRLENSGKPVSLGGEWKENFLSTSSKQFGRFAIMADTAEPVLKAMFDTSGSVAPPVLKFLLSDNLSGIQTYRAEINGRWMLMEYDAKSGMLTGELVTDTSNTTNGTVESSTFILTATDFRKNSITFKKVFSK